MKKKLNKIIIKIKVKKIKNIFLYELSKIYKKFKIQIIGIKNFLSIILYKYVYNNIVILFYFHK